MGSHCVQIEQVATPVDTLVLLWSYHCKLFIEGSVVTYCRLWFYVNDIQSRLSLKSQSVTLNAAVCCGCVGYHLGVRYSVFVEAEFLCTLTKLIRKREIAWLGKLYGCHKITELHCEDWLQESLSVRLRNCQRFVPKSFIGVIRSQERTTVLLHVTSCDCICTWYSRWNFQRRDWYRMCNC